MQTIKAYVKKFDENGYLLLKGFFSKKLCKEIKEYSKKLKPKVNIPFSKIGYGYGNLYNIGPIKKINEDIELNKLIKAILKSNYVFNHIMLANKHRWIGPDTELHQEIFNVNTFAPGANPKRDWKKFIQIFIPIDDHKEGSGRLRIFPSSHKMGQLKHEDCVNSLLGHKRRVTLKDIDKVYKKFNFKKLSLDGGDLLIFNTRLVHGSPSNLSNNERMSLVGQVRHSSIKFNKRVFEKECNYRSKVVQDYLLQKLKTLNMNNIYKDFKKNEN